MFKMVFCVRKRQGMSDQAFYDYWLNRHGPFVVAHAPALKIRRYVQSHTTDTELGQTVTSGRGMKLGGFDGIAEVWWDNREDLLMALNTEDGNSSSMALAEDEAKFIDMENSTIFFTEEHCVIEA